MLNVLGIKHWNREADLPLFEDKLGRLITECETKEGLGTLIEALDFYSLQLELRQDLIPPPVSPSPVPPTQ
jgi:hypothetical protein